MGKIYFILFDLIRSSKILTQLIWHVKIETKLHNVFWDLTSLVLKKEITTIKNKKKFLDMGCGQFALIGQFFKKKNLNSDVVAVDIYSEFVNNSIKNVKFNNINLRIIKSNLFSNLKYEKFDLISFNPPYVPTKRDDNEKRFKKIRYSGNDGTLIISKFLDQVKKHLLPHGQILLGVNTFYVSQKKCTELIIKKKFKIKKIITMKFNTSIVFKLSTI